MNSYTIEELLDYLKERYDEIGRLPKIKEFTHPTSTVYYSRFGGLTVIENDGSVYRRGLT